MQDNMPESNTGTPIHEFMSMQWSTKRGQTGQWTPCIQI